MTDINGERLQIIDGIRGLSLAGILMANMLIFQYGIWRKEEIHLYSPSKMDSVAYTFTKIFIEGSFMPIFAFLFGFGMIKMKQSLDRKALKYKRYFFRRFLFLLVVGFLHSTYLWEGDILFFLWVDGPVSSHICRPKEENITNPGKHLASSVLLARIREPARYACKSCSNRGIC